MKPYANNFKLFTSLRRANKIAAKEADRVIFLSPNSSFSEKSLETLTKSLGVKSQNGTVDKIVNGTVDKIANGMSCNWNRMEGSSVKLVHPDEAVSTLDLARRALAHSNSKTFGIEALVKYAPFGSTLFVLTK